MRRPARFMMRRAGDIAWAMATIVMICTLLPLAFFLAIFTGAGIVRYAIDKKYNGGHADGI
jgi:hypothetical protein